MNEQITVEFPDKSSVKAVVLGHDENGNYKCSALHKTDKLKEGEIFYCNEDTHKIIKESVKMTRLAGLKHILSAIELAGEPKPVVKKEITYSVQLNINLGLEPETYIDENEEWAYDDAEESRWLATDIKDIHEAVKIAQDELSKEKINESVDIWEEVKVTKGNASPNHYTDIIYNITKDGIRFVGKSQKSNILKVGSMTRLAGLKTLLNNYIHKMNWGFDIHKSPWKYNKVTGKIEKDPDAIKKLARKIKTALDESDEKAFRCNQCEMMMINGVPCHETGCPNAHKVWDKESGEWIEPQRYEEDLDVRDEEDLDVYGKKIKALNKRIKTAIEQIRPLHDTETMDNAKVSNATNKKHLEREDTNIKSINKLIKEALNKEVDTEGDKAKSIVDSMQSIYDLLPDDKKIELSEAKKRLEEALTKIDELIKTQPKINMPNMNLYKDKL